MTKREACERIMQVGIVPVVRACSADKALRAVEAITWRPCPYRLTDTTLTLSIPQRFSLCHENFYVLEGLSAFDWKENPTDPPGGVA